MTDIISKWWYMLTGNNKLKAYEHVCLDAWREYLDENSIHILDIQLAKFDYISRVPDGLKTVFYSVRDPNYKSWTKTDFFENHSLDFKVFSGMLLGNIGDLDISVSFIIYLHRGRRF